VLLMLIDTHDPRYPRDEGDEPGPRRRDLRLRLWLPAIGMIVSFVATSFVPPLVAYVLIIVGLMCFFDVAAKLLPASDGLSKYQQ
jgi:hypothetical protein